MKIILSLLFLTLALFGRADLDEYAQKMGFERDYNTALAKAKELHRPLMLTITKPECPWCDRLEDQTFTDLTVHKHLNKEVVVILVYKDFDKESYPSKKFVAPFSPRTFFIDPSSQEAFLIINGYAEKGKFLDKLDEVKRLWNK